MKKLITISILLLISAIAFCQVSNTDQNFQKGKKAFKAKKYKEALAYFSISIGESPTAQAYSYRSMTYDIIGDSCNSCKDLKTISSLYIEEYQKLYIQKCSYITITDNIPVEIKLKYSEVTKLKIVRFKCVSDTLIFGIIGEEPAVEEIEIDLSENKNITVDRNDTIAKVEIPPLYPGGDYERMKFIQNNIRYPSLAREYGIQGTVYASFMLDETGQIFDIKIIRGIGGGCDEEAIRVIKLMPKWKPATQNGKPVTVEFGMPIKYTVSGNFRTK